MVRTLEIDGPLKVKKSWGVLLPLGLHVERNSIWVSASGEKWTFCGYGFGVGGKWVSATLLPHDPKSTLTEGDVLTRLDPNDGAAAQ